jgi:microcystin-dependent protein
VPRNSSGDYSLPAGTTVNTGDTLLVSQHNPPFQDVAQALSSSLDRDGKGGMRANLQMNGNKITGAAPGTDPTDVATVSQLPVGATSGVPIGAVIDYWGATPPADYLFAAGQAVSRTTYAALFAVIGTSAGAGDGSTTFNLPDYRGRVGAGRENMATPATTRLNTLSSSTLGASGGAQTHTLTEAQMPVHNHSVTDPGHSHTYTRPVFALGNPTTTDSALASTSSATTNLATTGITIGNKGGGEAHNIVQPTIICQKIIRIS